MKEYLEIGKITSPKGLKGEVKVTPWCDSPSFFKDFEYLYLDKEKTKLKINSFYSYKYRVIIKFNKIDTRSNAENLCNKILYILKKDAKLDEGTYFLQDVIGSKVLDADTNFEYGAVKDIFKTGANDIYEIFSNSGKTHLMPATKEVLIDINLEKKIVLIRPIKGIFSNEN